MSIESGSSSITAHRSLTEPLQGREQAPGAPAASSPSPSQSLANKIVKVLNTEITLPTLPKRLVADIHLHERLAKQKEALVFLSAHQAITHGNVKLAAEVITETLARLFNNEYTGVWLLNETKDYLHVLDEYVSSRAIHEPDDEYARSEFPGWFESLMTNEHIVAHNEMDMFNVKPEFFEHNQKWGVKSGLETIIHAYGEEKEVIGLLQSDDTVEREFFDDEIQFHRQIADLIAIAIHNEKYHLLEIQIHKSEQDVQSQRDVLREITNLKSLNDGDTKTTFDFICQKLTELYGIDGCTIWQTFGSTDKLTCISSYDKHEGFFTDLRSYDIERRTTPIYFDVIASGRCFAVDDVSQDVHLSELFDQQIAPSGTVSVLDMGAFHGKQLMGSICLDSSIKRKWHNTDKLFVTEITKLISECILTKENKQLTGQLRILSSAAEHSSCAIFALDNNLQIQYCNSQFEQLTGLDKDKLMSSSINQLAVTEDSAIDFGRMLTSVRGAKPWKGKLEFVNHQGQSRIAIVTATPLYDDKSIMSEVLFFCE